LLKRCSSQKASIASCALRFRLRSGVRNRFFANCCVRVDPPCTTRPEVKFAWTARASPIGSMPQWSRKRRSSMEIKAAGRCAGISRKRSVSPYKSPLVASSLPSDASNVVEGRRVVASAASGRGKSQARISKTTEAAINPQIIARKPKRSRPQRRRGRAAGREGGAERRAPRASLAGLRGGAPRPCEGLADARAMCVHIMPDPAAKQ